MRYIAIDQGDCNTAFESSIGLSYGDAAWPVNIFLPMFCIISDNTSVQVQKGDNNQVQRARIGIVCDLESSRQTLTSEQHAM